MARNRETRRLTQNKLNAIEIKKVSPTSSEGNNGDITIRQLNDGVFLFFKALGRWYKTLNTSSQAIPVSADPHNPGSLEFGVSEQDKKSPPANCGRALYFCSSLRA